MAGLGYLFKCLLSCLILLYTCEGNNFDTTKAYCPFTNFCTENYQTPFNGTADVIPCCMNCSCDADCWTFDDCCPDVVHLKPDELQRAECMPLTVKTSFFPESSNSYYRVIAFCPRDYDVKFVIDQCEERFHNNTEPLDVVAVSDSKNRIYKNRFCALCHGVTDVVSWSLVATEWREGVTALQMTASDFQRTFLDNYALESVPPAKLSMVHMRCGHIIIDYCSASASTEQQEEACRLGPYMLLFATTDQGLALIFKNVFCAICTVGTIVVQHMCENSRFLIERSDIMSFSLVLDTSLSDRVPEEMTSPHCSPLEVYDDVKVKCMKLFCPPYSLVSNGKCVQHVRLSTAGGILRVLYEPKEKLIISDSIHLYQEDEARKYVGRMLRRYGLKTENCLYFSISSIRDTTSNRIEFLLVEIMLILNTHYQMHDVAGDMTTRLSRNHDATIFINDMAVEVTGKLTYLGEESRSYLLQDTKERLPVLTVFASINIHSFVIGFFLCPYFVLNITEYNSIISREFGNTYLENQTEITMFTYIRDGFFGLSNNSIAVCVDTYFGIFEKNGCSSRSILFSQWFCIILTLVKVWPDSPWMGLTVRYA